MFAAAICVAFLPSVAHAAPEVAEDGCPGCPSKAEADADDHGDDGAEHEDGCDDCQCCARVIGAAVLGGGSTESERVVTAAVMTEALASMGGVFERVFKPPRG